MRERYKTKHELRQGTRKNSEKLKAFGRRDSILFLRRARAPVRCWYWLLSHLSHGRRIDILFTPCPPLLHSKQTYDTDNRRHMSC